MNIHMTKIQAHTPRLPKFSDIDLSFNSGHVFTYSTINCTSSKTSLVALDLAQCARERTFDLSLGVKFVRRDCMHIGKHTVVLLCMID